MINNISIISLVYFNGCTIKKKTKQDEGGNGQDDLSESKIGTV